MRLFGKWKEKRDLQIKYGDVGFFESIGNSISLLFGNNKGNYGSMNISSVFRAVDFISSQFAMLPLEVVRDIDGYLIPQRNHSAYNLLNKEPNVYLTRHQLFKSVIIQMLLKGNAYIYITRDDKGNAIRLDLIDSDKVSIRMIQGEGRLEYIISDTNINLPNIIDPIDVIHIKNITDDGIKGKSTLSYAAQSLGLAKALENQASDFFESGCAVNGIISGNVAEKKITEIKKAWSDSFTSGGKGVAVIPTGLNYQPVSINATDSQLLESREFTVTEIARWFNISPILLYDLSRNSYSSSEASSLEFLQNTLTPIIDKIQLEIYKKLFKPSEKKLGFDIRFDTESILRGDLKTTASYYSQLYNLGSLSSNDVRKKLGLPAVKDGDSYYIQSNLLPLNYYNGKTFENSEPDGKLDVEEGGVKIE